MQDFSQSWSDGLALLVPLGRVASFSSLLFRCALIHCHRPDLLDYDKLNKVLSAEQTQSFIDELMPRPTDTETHCWPSRLLQNISIFLFVSSSLLQAFPQTT